MTSSSRRQIPRTAAFLAAACATGALTWSGAPARAESLSAMPASPMPSRSYRIASASPHGLLAIANSVRARCGSPSLALSPLQAQSTLNAAARRLAAGAGLRQATASVGYRAMSSVSIYVMGDLSDESLVRMLSSRFCRQLSSPALRDVGFYQQGSNLWILAAAPFATPALQSPAAVAREVLALVNAARARGRRCGRREFGPAPPLHLSARLREAALLHSVDMAAHSYLDHVGRDGGTPADRVTRTGYGWSAIGENIAAGPTSAGEAAAGWLASPEHCANIMDPSFTQTGIAFSVERASRAGVYWTEVFAAPLIHPGRARRRGGAATPFHER